MEAAEQLLGKLPVGLIFLDPLTNSRWKMCHAFIYSFPTFSSWHFLYIRARMRQIRI